MIRRLALALLLAGAARVAFAETEKPLPVKVMSGTITATSPAGGTTVYFPAGFTMPKDNPIGSTVYYPTGYIVPVAPGGGATFFVQPKVSDLSVSVTGVESAAVTLSLPSVSGQFHHITHIEIVKYVGTAIAAGAAPIIVTTTNLPGGMDFNFRRVGSVADAEVAVYTFSSPLRSSAVTTATTIVFPAVTGVKWVARVVYHTAPPTP